MTAISVEGLEKSFGSVKAVRGISFEVPDGSIFAFLGTNGAGKSTTIGCVTTTLVPTRGSASVAGLRVGRDDERIRAAIGVVFQSSLLDPALTVRENLMLRGGFYGIERRRLRERVDQLAALVALGSFLDRRYGQLSGGQKRRADIARALVHRPSVLFLDEPTAGLDPQSREQVWSTIHDLRQSDGLTVFLTTHYMQETEEADRVCIIDAGRAVAEGTPAELRRQYSSSVLSLTPRSVDGFLAVAHEEAIPVRRERDVLHVAVPDAEHALALLDRHRALIGDFEFRHGTMDDVFLAVTEGSEAA